MQSWVLWVLCVGVWVRGAGERGSKRGVVKRGVRAAHLRGNLRRVDVFAELRGLEEDTPEEEGYGQK
jgi:hypothetical protein